MLKIKNLNKGFGGLKAVNNVNLEVKKSSITGLIGPNGAGKTTLFNTIAGVYEPENGEIYLEDKNIAKDIILLKSQAERCKEILQTFSKNPLKLKDKLLEVKNYPGVTGKTDIMESGDSEKIIFALTVRRKKIVEEN